eukprot:gene26461-31980_t
MDLSNFLWKDVQPVANKLFPKNQLGEYVLKRDRVVKKVVEAVASQRTMFPCETRSVYLSGCHGSGKTSLLMLLAKELKAEGHEVYFFESAAGIPLNAWSTCEDILGDKSKKVAVLIDEVAANPSSALLIILLKGAHPNLVMIGSAVPSFVPTMYDASFYSKLGTADLMLKEDDEDFLELVQYCVGLKATTPELTKSICEYLRKHCGGMTFPTVAFIEYFFTREDAKEFLTSMQMFHRYFCGLDFTRSPFYEDVRRRCFGHLCDHDCAAKAVAVLGGKEAAGDVATLIQLGWWDSSAGGFSEFLVNALLSVVLPNKDDAVYLDEARTTEENAELVIVEGLSGMEESDFKCWRDHSSSVRAVSFNWAHKVRARVPNASLSTLEHAVSSGGVVDLYLNDGVTDTTIGVMLDATRATDAKAKGLAKDIDTYEKRLREGRYPWERYVLLNFAMSQAEVVLPTDSSAHDKVYTFVHSSNTLFRGAKAIKTRAVPMLYADWRYFSRDQTRSYSTMTRRFMTCVRRL